MPNYRLLALEDNQNIADMVCHAATDMGFEARSASGVDAIHLYNSFKPHIVVLDILMPEVDGLEFLGYLEKYKSRSRVIILSGTSESCRTIAENWGESSGISIVANLAKPFRIAEMRALFTKIRTDLDAESEKSVNTA